MTPAQIKYKAYYEANKDRLRAKAKAEYYADRLAKIAANREWKKANPDRVVARSRKLNLTKAYGPDALETYAKLFEAQHGCCAICCKPPEEGKHLDVDHCHVKETVRGLLCGPCNRGLAAFRDDVSRMQNAIRYLER